MAFKPASEVHFFVLNGAFRVSGNRRFGICLRRFAFFRFRRDGGVLTKLKKGKKADGGKGYDRQKRRKKRISLFAAATTGVLNRFA